ncbi:M20/M25/M40 family metallo-hydrolase [Candidatus Vidania fulgoroideorum]
MIYDIFSKINNITALKFLYKISKKNGFFGKIIKKKNISNLLIFNTLSKKIDILFVSHIDTVYEGDMKYWTTFPYSGKVVKKNIVSRGAVDMKGAIISFFRILKKTKKRISIVVSGDEEGKAKYGSRIVSKYLVKNKYLIFLCLIGEPTSKKKVCDTYKTGRRGSCNIMLSIKGIQGHTAYLNGINPFDKFFLLKKFIKCNKNISISLIGIKTNRIIFNLTPEIIKIYLNIRYTKIRFLNIFFKELINVLKKNFNIKKISNIKPFYSKKKKTILNKLKIKKIGNYTGGTSDGRFFQYSKFILEIGLKNKYIHKTNERCSVKDIYKLSKIYEKIIY